MSIPTNIAEGSGRNSDADFARFLSIASGSASETEYLLLLAKDLLFIDEETHAKLSNDVIELKKMLFALIKKLRANS